MNIHKAGFKVNGYNSSKLTGKKAEEAKAIDVDLIRWESRITATAQAIINLANTQLKSFRLRLVMEDSE